MTIDDALETTRLALERACREHREDLARHLHAQDVDAQTAEAALRVAHQQADTAIRRELDVLRRHFLSWIVSGSQAHAAIAGAAAAVGDAETCAVEAVEA